MRFLFVRVYCSRSRFKFIRTRRKPDYLRYAGILVNFRNCRINTFLLKSKRIRCTMCSIMEGGTTRIVDDDVIGRAEVVLGAAADKLNEAGNKVDEFDTVD